MKGFFNGLIFGIIIGAAGFWFLQSKAREHPAAEQRAETAASEAKSSATQMAQHFSDALRAKMETLDLRPEEIKDELARTGKVVRRNARDVGDQVADAASNARIVAAIKAKYAANPDLSVWKISVSCDQGHVALSGTVSAADKIGEAVALGLDVEGVRDVTSTLAVKPNS